MPTNTFNSVRISVDAGEELGALAPNWNYIGYDEINYTYVPEGQALLAKFGALGYPYYVRAHHLFCTGNCHGLPKWGSTNAYLEDEAGNPIYDWTIVDLVFDAIVRHGGKPFVELGFMPLDLADPARYDAAHDNYRLQNYQGYGWACPPKDYGKWYELVFALVRHCLDRYGRAEVEAWYWELWNEPDLDYYWQGSVAEFCRLYDYTAAAVKAACPRARVGGPATTNPAPGSRAAEFLDTFLEHCAHGVNSYTGATGAALDFITFHVKGGGYRADPKHRKAPPPSVKQVLGHTQNGHAIIAKYPMFKDLECVLSEIDPDGWAAGGAWDNHNLNFRNTEYYPSFVAAAFDKLGRYARRAGWNLKLLSWAFLFVGERCFEGTRTFSTQGIDKPILNLMRMYARLGAREVAFASAGTQDPLQYADQWGHGQPPDIGGCATLGDRGLAILIYNHHDDWDLSGEYSIELEIANLPFANQALELRHYRIDGAHSNGYSEWVRQGQPMYPNAEQRAAIEARAGLELLHPPQLFEPHDGALRLSFSLPVHGIALLCLEPTV